MCLVLCIACGEGRPFPDAATCLREGDSLLRGDSVVQGETLMRQAIRMAEKEGDWHTLYIAHQRLAQSVAWANAAEALRLMKRALAIYEQHPDDERNHIILLDFAGTYAAQLAYNTDGSYDEALALTKRAQRLAEEGRHTDLVCQTLTSLANIYWAMNDYAATLRCAHRAEALAPPDLLQGTLQVLARCYLSCDSLAEAEAVYRRMKPEGDLHAAYVIQSNLAKIAVRRLLPAEAKDTVDAAFEQAEQLYFKALAEKDDYYQQTLQQERQNERLAYSEALHRRTLVAILAVILVVATATFLLLRYRMRMLHQRRIHQERLHQQETRILQQETQLLQQEAETQRTQLHQKTEVISFLKNLIIQRSEVFRKLNKSLDAHVELTPQEWNDMERTLNAVENDRFAHLRTRYPNLREEDVRLCILVSLQLSNRAIGNIYGLTISAVQHRKQKLKKDGLGEPDPDISLEQVLDRLGS